MLPAGSSIFDSANSREARADHSSRTLGVNYLLLAAALWLANHHYGGIYHDAWLYAVTALHWLDPTPYQHDPFFMFGSQGDFTIFSPLYAWLIQGIGLAHAAMLVVVFGAFLWIAALWLTSRGLLEDARARGVALLFGVVYAISYSPNHETFVINETFATARSLALPLGLMGVACSVAGRKWLAWGLGLFSLLLHPLIGVWAFAIIVTSRWNNRALLSGLLLMVMLLVIGRFSGLPIFQPMMPGWLQLVGASTGDVLVGPLGTVRLNAHLFWISTLWLGGCRGSPAGRRWYLLTAFFAAWGFLAALVCSYLYPIELLVQAQLWRVMWIAIPMSIFAAVDVSWRFVRDRDRFVLLSGIYFLLYAIKGFSGFLLLFAAVVCRVGDDKSVAALDRIVQCHRRWFYIFLGGVALVMIPNYIQELVLLGDGWGVERWEYLPAIRGFLVAGGIGLGPPALALALSRFSRFRACSLLLVLLPVLAAWNWDRRAPVTRAWESYASTNPISPLAAYVKPGDTVMWPANVHRVWYELRTASYASDRQTIGIVFSRQKSGELMRRLSRLAIGSRADHWPLDQADQSRLLQSYRDSKSIIGADFDDIHKYDPGKLTDAGIAYLCEDVMLDWVISTEIPRTPIVVPIRFKDPWQVGNLSLYDCKHFRAETTQHSSPMPGIGSVLGNTE